MGVRLLDLDWKSPPARILTKLRRIEGHPETVRSVHTWVSESSQRCVESPVDSRERSGWMPAISG